MLVKALEEAEQEQSKEEKPHKPVRVLRSPEEIRALINGDYKRGKLPISEVVRILRIERDCVKRNEDKNCTRDCEVCDLVQDTDVLIRAYTTAIDYIESKEMET